MNEQQIQIKATDEKLKKYWENVHEIYLKKSWIDEPSVFAVTALGYFPKEGKILDLGAGQGQDSRFFAKKGYEVISTDLSEYALDISKEKAKKEGVNMEFLRIDLAKDKLSFDDGSVDVIYSHLSLHYFDNKRTAEIFQEIYRVLKQGGIVAMLFNTVEDEEIKNQEFKLIEENYYEDPHGAKKRYFSVDYLKDITNGLFHSIVLDGKGERHSDEARNFIRFIGSKK